MPPKKRKSIYGKTANAKRATSVRQRESVEQRELRLEQMRERAAARRAQEMPEQNQFRLEGLRSRAAARRALETPEQNRLRLEEVRVRVAARRAQETPSENQARQESNLQQYNLRQSLGPVRARTEAANNLEVLKMPGAAFTYDPTLNYKIAADIGQMSIICPKCLCMKWTGETKGMCCSDGKVKLAPLKEPLEPLKTLLSGITPDSKHLLKNPRSYNSLFQATSFGADKIVRERGFMPTFKIQGQVYHKVGSLLAESDETAKFLQIYFISDPHEQALHRCNIIPGTRENIVESLQELFLSTNDLIKDFIQARENPPADEFDVVIHADKVPIGEHPRRFNAPSVTEVAAVITGQEHGKRDIVIHHKGDGLRRIDATHRCYDALQYPLLYSQGEDGYHWQIAKLDSDGQPTNQKVSAMAYYAYMLMIRQESFNHLHRARELFLQFLVDMYAKIESERLAYIRSSQKELRVDSYGSLRDAINNDANIEAGKLVVLPSTFTGGPRYMHERTQDAMMYVRHYGRPDLFLTFTCNPKWKEISQELFPGQEACHRHDLVARVFKQKLNKLMALLTKNSVFGQVRCDMYTIEWQKRGLPHAHILLWLKEKIRPAQIDSIISAEFPDPNIDKELYDIVKSHMVHGPCGRQNPNSPCMVDVIRNGVKTRECSKKYPKPFIKDTKTGNDGYPTYKRRKPEDGGYTADMSVRGQAMVVDNKWVVPFPPFLLKTFDAHINLEYCNSIKSIKYMFKYVTKGSDMAVFNLHHTDRDEVTQFQTGRYISSNEAAWRIFGFPIHERNPAIFHLAVHLENGERVYFTEENLQEIAQAPPVKSTLTGFFKLCEEDEFARTLFYSEVPRYYTWDKKERKWKRRLRGNPVDGQIGIKSTDTLGRVYGVHPNQFECFYLRMLLHELKGPTSFQDLRTVDGVICSTYREACQLRGMLETDEHWDATMAEASISHAPSKLRTLFSIMLHYCNLSSPYNLWLNYRESLAEDILYQHQQLQPQMTVQFNEEIFNHALVLLEDRVISLGGQALKDYGLPAPDRSRQSMPVEIIREKSYDTDELIRYVAETENKLTPEQRRAYDAITGRSRAGNGGMFFIDSPGGTGKTFLINVVLANIRKDKNIALSVASSGIAATLLAGGRTAHSMFKLPLNLSTLGTGEVPTCNISKGSPLAKVLSECRLIVWDECTMSHKSAFEAVDRTLQDIRGNKLPMGGVTFVMAGDFRQTLPVIPRGTRANEVDACIKNSHLWKHVQKFALTINMRVHLQGDETAGHFSYMLLKLGDGKFQPDSSGLIPMKDIGNVVLSSTDLLTSVFPDIHQHYKDSQWLCERAILAPKNDIVTDINSQLLQKIPGETHLFKSIDTIPDEDEAVQYPVEFLNSLEIPGVPPHRLQLKLGSPIMLLRNMDAPKLCNGTRLVVKQLLPHVIEATVITGVGKGEDVFIPKIPIIPTDLPFQFKRLQFPVKLSFAMTINKSQGQSIKFAGINLESPCFSHGQLYVGCSRVGCPKNLYIYCPNGKTTNVVYPEALT